MSQGGIEMTKHRKLASPVVGTFFIGDNNDDIPLMMTEEHPLNV